MAATSDRYQQVILPGKMYGREDIRNVSALSDEPRSAADHRVIDFACLVVTRVCGFDQLASELALELSNGFLVHRFLSDPGNSHGFNSYCAMPGVPKPFYGSTGQRSAEIPFASAGDSCSRASARSSNNRAPVCRLR